METNFADLLGEHPEWHLMLQAYQQAEAVVAEQLAQERAAAKKAGKAAAATIEVEPATDESLDAAGDEGGDDAQRKQTWVRRLKEVEGVPADRLAPIHGRLIAEGLLQFSLGGRDEGVLYRLTRDAKQTLAALPAIVAGTVTTASELDKPGPVPQAA